MKNLHILQQESVDEGKLQVRIRQKNLGTPVSGASVRISFSGDPDGNIEEAGTDESGNSQMVTVKTPPLEYSMEPMKPSHIQKLLLRYRRRAIERDYGLRSRGTSK